MSAATYNIVIEKYATFRLPLQIKNGSGESLTPTDITGLAPRMQIRASYAETEVLLELNVANGRIVVTSAVDGELYVEISAVETSSIAWNSAVYDLVLIGEGDVRRIIQGTVTVSDGVTR